MPHSNYQFLYCGRGYVIGRALLRSPLVQSLRETIHQALRVSLWVGFGLGMWGLFVWANVCLIRRDPSMEEKDWVILWGVGFAAALGEVLIVLVTCLVIGICGSISLADHLRYLRIGSAYGVCIWFLVWLNTMWTQSICLKGPPDSQRICTWLAAVYFLCWETLGWMMMELLVFPSLSGCGRAIYDQWKDSVELVKRDLEQYEMEHQKQN
jgi:hypothetical protein